MDSSIAENACRLCANHGKNYHAIFTADSYSIAHKINNCLPIVISPNDGLPTDICSPCLQALNTSDELRLQSLVADQILRQRLIQVLRNIKKEIVESDNKTKDENVAETLFCEVCVVNFTDINDFDYHMQAYHSSEWICNLCNENFKTSEKLLQHKHTSHYDNADMTDNNPEDIEHANLGVSADQFDNDDLLTIKDEIIPLGENKIVEEEPKTCHICNVTIDTEDEMLLHLKLHEPRSTYCGSCLRSYRSPYDLLLHKQTAHRSFVDQQMKWFCEKCERFGAHSRFLKRHQNCKKRKFKCKYCKVEFRTAKLLDIHKTDNHLETMLNDPKTKTFKCSTCGEEVIGQYFYKLHVRGHKAQLEERHECPKCNKVFPNATQLRIHMEEIHVRQWTHRCHDCGQAFYSARLLSAHSRGKHEFRTCSECNESFKDKRTLERHLAEVHLILPTTRKYASKICGKKSHKLMQLEGYENFHSGKRPYACDSYEETSSSLSTRSHSQRHNEAGFYCDYCQQKFATKSMIRRHLLSHVSPSYRKFECGICKEKFKKKIGLNRHLKKHSVDRPFQCDICDDRFLTDALFVRHQKQHHKVAYPLRKRRKNSVQKE